jgi:hypothetical protein
VKKEVTHELIEDKVVRDSDLVRALVIDKSSKGLIPKQLVAGRVIDA